MSHKFVSWILELPKALYVGRLGQISKIFPQNILLVSFLKILTPQKCHPMVWWLHGYPYAVNISFIIGHKNQLLLGI